MSSSIKANTGFLIETTNNDGKGKRTTWCYLDTSGHWGASRLVSMVVEKESINCLVLVLDSTQPIRKAADYLYALLLQQQQQQKQGSSFRFKYSNQQSSIALACHKSKAPKAKNVGSLKLQFRNELERLSKLDATTNSTTTTTTDWDDVLNNRVRFVTTMVDPPLMNELADKQTNKLPCQNHDNNAC
jgi:hypothetical protein